MQCLRASCGAIMLLTPSLQAGRSSNNLLAKRREDTSW